MLRGQGDLELGKFKDIVQAYARTYRVRSREYQNDNWELILELSFVSPAGKKIEAMLAGIRGLEGVEQVSLLAPQLALPM